MRLNFLCQHHRRWLTENPEEARRLWFDSAERLDTEPVAPSPYQVNLAGSALEAAGIYLLAHPRCGPELLERYVHSTLALIDMLSQLRQSRLGVVVVAGATAMVEHLAREGADRAAALEACRRITIEGLKFMQVAASTGVVASSSTAPRRACRPAMATLH